MSDQTMSSVLHAYEWAELESWVRSEYPDMAKEFDCFPKILSSFIDQHYPDLVREFDCFPKTLGDFISQKYSYLVREFIEATR